MGRNPDLHSALPLGPAGGRPPGMDPGFAFYSFAAPIPEAELKEIFREAQLMAQLEGGAEAILNGVVKPAPGYLGSALPVGFTVDGARPEAAVATGVILPVAAGLAPPRLLGVLPAGDAAGEWRSCIYLAGKVRFGETVPDPPPAHVSGDYGLTRLTDGTVLPCKRVDAQTLEEFLDSGLAGDARVLPVRLLGGKRHRGWFDISRAIVPEEFDDWPLPGQKLRTAKWCSEYLAKEEESIERHHEKFKSIVKVDQAAWGIAEHYQLSQLLKLLGEYDQIDLSNSAAAESAFRRLQTIEFSYLDKAREAEGRSSGGSSKLTAEEQSILSGTARSSANLMVCPALLDYARTETDKEAQLLKNLQKAREGREALRRK